MELAAQYPEKIVGTADELVARQKRMNADIRYVLAHEDSWREQFPDEFVAVYAGKLLAHADSLDRLLGELRNSCDRIDDVLTWFVSKERQALVL